MKIGYQLKQVRERLLKGLVDKGILRTEKKNFLLFDMATHPVADGGPKEEIRRRVRNVLTQRTVVLPASQWLPENLEFRNIRTISMVCAAYAANVLENALASLGHEARERAFAQVDELLAEYSQWPFGKRAGATNGGVGANLNQVVQDVSLFVSEIFLTFQGSPLTTPCRKSTKGKTRSSSSRSSPRVSASSPGSTLSSRVGSIVLFCASHIPTLTPQLGPTTNGKFFVSRSDFCLSEIVWRKTS